MYDRKSEVGRESESNKVRSREGELTSSCFEMEKKNPRLPYFTREAAACGYVIWTKKKAFALQAFLLVPSLHSRYF